MLSVATASDALAVGAFAKDVDADAAALLSEAFDGATSTEHSRDVSTETSEKGGDAEKGAAPRLSFVETVKKTLASTSTTVELEDEENDSDYRPDDEEELGEEEEDDDDDEDEEEDDEAYLQSLEAQLDEHADEVGDYYLRRMLEKRASLEGDEAEWVDSYIARQRKWKETHGTSIDEMDLDLLRPARRSKPHKPLDAVVNGRVSSLLPWGLRDQPAEFLLSLVGVVLFVGIALGVQFYVAFKAPQYS